MLRIRIENYENFRVREDKIGAILKGICYFLAPNPPLKSSVNEAWNHVCSEGVV